MGLISTAISLIDPLQALVDAVSGGGSKKSGSNSSSYSAGAMSRPATKDPRYQQAASRSGAFKDPASSTGWSWSAGDGRINVGTRAPHRWVRTLTDSGRDPLYKAQNIWEAPEQSPLASNVLKPVKRKGPSIPSAGGFLPLALASSPIGQLGIPYPTGLQSPLYGAQDYGDDVTLPKARAPFTGVGMATLPSVGFGMSEPINVGPYKAPIPHPTFDQGTLRPWRVTPAYQGLSRIDDLAKWWWGNAGGES